MTIRSDPTPSTDEKGTTVAVPADKIAYLNFTADAGRPVGFGQISAM